MANFGRNETISAILFGFGILVLICFGISVAEIHRRGRAYPGTLDTGLCQEFPANLTTFTATKKLMSQWNWRYDFDDFPGKIEHVCPSANHDVNVYVGLEKGKSVHLAARSDGKIMTTVTRTYVKDCSGKVLYVMRTGNIGQTIINSNKIIVSFELRDEAEKNVLAYVEGTHFLTDDINILDINGTIVANMKRNTFKTTWKWIFTRHNLNHPGSDPRVLSIIAGRKAFGDNNKVMRRFQFLKSGSKSSSSSSSGSSEQSDICNNYYFGVGILLIVIGVLVGLFICYVLFMVGKNGWDNKRSGNSFFAGLV